MENNENSTIAITINSKLALTRIPQLIRCQCDKNKVPPRALNIEQYFF